MFEISNVPTRTIEKKMISLRCYISQKLQFECNLSCFFYVPLSSMLSVIHISIDQHRNTIEGTDTIKVRNVSTDDQYPIQVLYYSE